MAGRRLLQEAARLGCALKTEWPSIAHRSLPGLAAVQGAQTAQQSSRLLRPFTSTTSPSAPTEQVERQAEQQAQQAGPLHSVTSAHRARHGWHGAKHSGKGHGQLFIPPQWEQQGWADLDHPLVQEMRAHVEAGDAQALMHAFEAHLAPLEAALSRGEQPAAADVPPRYAWKLYFAAMAATPALALKMCDLLDIQQKLGVPAQAACYVLALRQMAKQGIGAPAYTKIQQMKHLDLPPTMRCYVYAIEACLRSQPPEHGFANKLFDEVAAEGLAKSAAQKTELGKLIMHAVREFARYRRFNQAMVLMDQLESMELRVPAFLVADVVHLATLAANTGVLLQGVARLERMTQTFQEVPGVSEPITRPLKVEEGLLLSVLEVAALKGHAELAEATWKLLERSVALPNTPSSVAASQSHLRKVAELEEDAAAAAEAEAAEAEATAAGEEAEEAELQAPDAAALTGQGGLLPSAQVEQLSSELEAGDAAAAEAAEAAEAVARGARGCDWAQRPSEEAKAAIAAQGWGMRRPSLLSHLALVHAYSKAGQLAPMFEAVAQLQQAYPEDPEVAAYHAGLPMCVDALARSAATCDQAFEVLEGWAKQGRHVSTEQGNLIVAACSQMGDLERAFATFDAFHNLGLTPDADTYNALMQGCIEHGRVETALQVFDTMQQAGVDGNAFTHHQLINACVVAGDVPSMMQALEGMEAAGFEPKLELLERCVARAERAGDRDAIQELLRRLFRNDYRIVGVEAKLRRWTPEGGMTVLTGSSKWTSREEVLRQMRKSHTIAKRIERRNQKAEAAETAPAAEVQQ